MELMVGCAPLFVDASVGTSTQSEQSPKDGNGRISTGMRHGNNGIVLAENWSRVIFHENCFSAVLVMLTLCLCASWNDNTATHTHT